MNSVDAGLPVADSWFAIDACGHGVFRIHEPAVHDFIQGNAFFVKGRDTDLLVDAGTGIASMRDALTGAGLVDKEIVAVATHSHYDHVGSIHEFERRLIHPQEADELVSQSERPTLDGREGDPEFLELVARAGIHLPRLLVTAVPHAGYDVRSYQFPPTPPTGFLDEGDVVDLGDRRFAVLHLPGHSPGGIGLFEEPTGVLFAGDVIYDDVLLAEGPGTDLHAYVASMRRLEAMPVSIVHGGHGPSFGRERMLEIIGAFLSEHEPAVR